MRRMPASGVLCRVFGTGPDKQSSLECVNRGQNIIVRQIIERSLRFFGCFL